MTREERNKLIGFIKANDSGYSYHDVNFKYYPDEELLALKKQVENQAQHKHLSPSRKNGMQTAA